MMARPLPLPALPRSRKAGVSPDAGLFAPFVLQGRDCIPQGRTGKSRPAPSTPERVKLKQPAE